MDGVEQGLEPAVRHLKAQELAKVHVQPTVTAIFTLSRDTALRS